ncbi:mitogen-activated protein kinase kinase kinase [Polyrhizophydium stewartii]|uniref:Mitogen-activated protein kinase kinase kinase n=1 Tax=Polyrhizophydium stewartii TaxID=2732419 RepID=A0ABR4N8T4_9FUNG
MRHIHSERLLAEIRSAGARQRRAPMPPASQSPSLLAEIRSVGERRRAGLRGRGRADNYDPARPSRLAHDTTEADDELAPLGPNRGNSVKRRASSRKRISGVPAGATGLAAAIYASAAAGSPIGSAGGSSGSGGGGGGGGGSNRGSRLFQIANAQSRSKSIISINFDDHFGRPSTIDIANNLERFFPGIADIRVDIVPTPVHEDGFGVAAWGAGSDAASSVGDSDTDLAARPTHDSPTLSASSTLSAITPRDKDDDEIRAQHAKSRSLDRTRSRKAARGGHAHGELDVTSPVSTLSRSAQHRAHNLSQATRTPSIRLVQQTLAPSPSHASSPGYAQPVSPALSLDASPANAAPIASAVQQPASPDEPALHTLASVPPAHIGRSRTVRDGAHRHHAVASLTGSVEQLRSGAAMSDDLDRSFRADRPSAGSKARGRPQSMLLSSKPGGGLSVAELKHDLLPLPTPPNGSALTLKDVVMTAIAVSERKRGSIAATSLLGSSSIVGEAGVMAAAAAASVTTAAAAGARAGMSCSGSATGIAATAASAAASGSDASPAAGSTAATASTATLPSSVTLQPLVESPDAHTAMTSPASSTVTAATDAKPAPVQTARDLSFSSAFSFTLGSEDKLALSHNAGSGATTADLAPPILGDPGTAVAEKAAESRRGSSSSISLRSRTMRRRRSTTTSRRESLNGRSKRSSMLRKKSTSSAHSACSVHSGSSVGAGSVSPAVAGMHVSAINPATNEQLVWVRGDLIGQGAFASVYLGIVLETGQMMAVKQVPTMQEEPGLARKNTAQRGRPAIGRRKSAFSPAAVLKHELELLQGLAHPHVIQCFGYEQTPEYTNIFLEYVAGRSIASVLAKTGPFADSLVWVFSAQTLSGLDYLHTQGVIHRDIKAANLLVDIVACMVKISDFGVSKKHGGSGDAAYRRISDVSVHGTVSWMSPETVRAKGYSAKVDIWSFGCAVLEMKTAKQPWHGLTMDLQIFSQLARGQAPPAPADMSAALSAFLKRCFIIDPDARPTAKELLADPGLAGVDPYGFPLQEYYTQAVEAWKNRRPSVASESDETDEDEDDDADADDEADYSDQDRTRGATDDAGEVHSD